MSLYYSRKYVVLSVCGDIDPFAKFPDEPVELIFTFPNVIQHRAFVSSMRQYGNRDACIGDEQRAALATAKIVSAGFISSDGKCIGKSDSLGIESRGDIDTELYNR